MGNICPWCCRNSDDSQLHDNLGDDSAVSNSQRSLTSPDVNDRTPLLSKSGSHNQYHQPVTSAFLSSSTNVEPSSLLTTIVPPPLPPPLFNDNHIDSTTKFSSNETAESSMAIIVERMLPDLIDVGGWGGGAHQTNINAHNSNTQNDHLKQILCKSLQSTRVSILPDAGTSNLSSLLSSRPISSELCHIVAHTANELSRLLIDEIKIVHKEELVYSSDIDKSDAIRASDKSNVTTDDEFYNELMEAPPEFEDHLIPDQCKDESAGIDHLVKCLNYRFHAYPIVFMGSLRQALIEALSPKQMSERRPFLIYVNNDKSIYTNLFCKQLLCNEKIIEYLMNNYVLWAWDVTFKSNEQKLNDICSTIFRPWTNEKQFNASLIDQYPLLIGVYRDIDGEYLFSRLIEGSNKKLSIDEFLSCLTQFKDKFFSSEQRYEKAKEEAKQQALQSLFQTRNIHHRSKHAHDREYIRSASMFAHDSLKDNPYLRHPKYSRLLSTDMGVKFNPDEMFSTNPPTREDMMRALERLRVDSDDADDEDDERTPTVERPAPKFP
ncbi:unnamed protein product [Rotaria sp. Silwood2]|nr:unnamed protein product [Rotaria sp. Silwood2]CAF2572542.1 unnamed protein product [Rotaria sp. Silwood2]CAF2816611.1 unnamed protein product [Rotaria sp. Silwood2]CAF2965563.1 unnamed protein product [Rotaria sp. Silwood2]CAF3901224.1 unnamed protein product [Rotaria sp. Silwood2]